MKKGGDILRGVREDKKLIGEFSKIFGINPRNRIIEFFLEVRGLDYSIGDVAKETGLNRATTYNTMEELIKEKTIIPTRKVSGGQLYTLNVKKQEVQILIKAFNMLLKNIVKEYGEKNKVKLYA